MRLVSSFSSSWRISSVSKSLERFPKIWKITIALYEISNFTPRRAFYKKRSSWDLKTSSDSSYFLIFDVQCLQTLTRQRGIGIYTLNFVSAICKKRPQQNFAAVLTTIALRADLELAVNTLEGLNCQNLDIFVLDPFLGRTKVSFIQAKETLKSQLEDLGGQGLIVLSPFEKLNAAIPFPSSPKYKRIGILYDLIPLHNPSEFLFSRKRRTSYQWSLENVSYFDLLLPISTETKNRWRSKFSSNSIQGVIYGGGFIGHFQAQKKFDDRFGVLCISAEQSHKNLVRLIQAYCMLPEDVQIANSLTVVGIRSNGARKRFARAGRHSKGEIVFTKYLNRTQLLEAYQGSRLLVMPSLTEGLSLPILEACSNGLVAIGSMGTVAEELLPDGSLLFDPLSIHSISTTMFKFLTSESEWAKALTHIESSAERFTWDETAKIALQAIERTICE